MAGAQVYTSHCMRVFSSVWLRAVSTRANKSTRNHRRPRNEFSATYTLHFPTVCIIMSRLLIRKDDFSFASNKISKSPEFISYQYKCIHSWLHYSHAGLSAYANRISPGHTPDDWPAERDTFVLLHSEWSESLLFSIRVGASDVDCGQTVLLFYHCVCPVEPMSHYIYICTYLADMPVLWNCQVI